MALIKCIECGNDVSDKADVCPHCGLRVEESLKKYKEEDERITREREDKINEELELEKSNSNTGTNKILNVFRDIFLRYPITSLVIIFFIYFGYKMNRDSEIEEKEKQDLIVKQQKEKDFADNKPQIILNIQSQTKDGNLEYVQNECLKYLDSISDNDLKLLCEDNNKQFNAFKEAQALKKKQEKEKEDLKNKQKEEAELKASMSPKAWKIHKKHPNWSIDDCKNLAEGRYWVGMSYDMLVVSFGGKPNSANPSNYGNETQWQWCWHNYTPSCFYDHNDDGIIDSYN